MTKTVRTCEYCKIEYQNLYTRKGTNDVYTLPTRFCSKSCAGKSRKALPSKEEVIQEVRNFINSKGEYCTRTEICNGIRRSSKTLTSLDISIVGENMQLGYMKPKSKFENQIGEILRNTFNDVVTQKSFEGLLGISGYPLKVDFYLPEYNIVVEADGSQHKDSNHPWAATNPNGSVKLYDDIKDVYFRDKGIALIRIPYKRVITSAYVLSFIVI